MQFVDQQRLLDIRAKEVFMPALSSTMTEGVIVAWLKKPGDKVDVGEMLMTVESDKADMDGTKTKNMLLLHLTFSFFVLLFSHC
jgi:glycine cleavage system H lipoate-binding protein